MRYVFKAIDFVISVVFLALCTKALCVHFYQDIERQLHARKLLIIEDTPSLIPSGEIAITQLPWVNSSRADADDARLHRYLRRPFAVGAQACASPGHFDCRSGGSATV